MLYLIFSLFFYLIVFLFGIVFALVALYVGILFFLTKKQVRHSSYLPPSLLSESAPSANEADPQSVTNTQTKGITMDLGRSLKTGNMKVKGSFKVWQNRYFDLRPGQLIYYGNHKTKKVWGIVKLHGCKIDHQNKKHGPGVKIWHPEEKCIYSSKGLQGETLISSKFPGSSSQIELCLSNIKEREQWFKLLVIAIQPNCESLLKDPDFFIDQDIPDLPKSEPDNREISFLQEEIANSPRKFVQDDTDISITLNTTHRIRPILKQKHALPPLPTSSVQTNSAPNNSVNNISPITGSPSPLITPNPSANSGTPVPGLPLSTQVQGVSAPISPTLQASSTPPIPNVYSNSATGNASIGIGGTGGPSSGGIPAMQLTGTSITATHTFSGSCSINTRISSPAVSPQQQRRGEKRSSTNSNQMSLLQTNSLQFTHSGPLPVYSGGGITFPANAAQPKNKNKNKNKNNLNLSALSASDENPADKGLTPPSSAETKTPVLPSNVPINNNNNTNAPANRYPTVVTDEMKDYFDGYVEIKDASGKFVKKWIVLRKGLCAIFNHEASGDCSDLIDLTGCELRFPEAERTKKKKVSPKIISRKLDHTRHDSFKDGAKSIDLSKTEQTRFDGLKSDSYQTRIERLDKHEKPDKPDKATKPEKLSSKPEKPSKLEKKEKKEKEKEKKEKDKKDSRKSDTKQDTITQSKASHIVFNIPDGVNQEQDLEVSSIDKELDSLDNFNLAQSLPPPSPRAIPKSRLQSLSQSNSLSNSLTSLHPQPQQEPINQSLQSSLSRSYSHKKDIDNLPPNSLALLGGSSSCTHLPSVSKNMFVLNPTGSNLDDLELMDDHPVRRIESWEAISGSEITCDDSQTAEDKSLQETPENERVVRRKATSYSELLIVDPVEASNEVEDDSSNPTGCEDDVSDPSEELDLDEDEEEPTAEELAVLNEVNPDSPSISRKERKTLRKELKKQRKRENKEEKELRKREKEQKKKEEKERKKDEDEKDIRKREEKEVKKREKEEKELRKEEEREKMKREKVERDRKREEEGRLKLMREEEERQAQKFLKQERIKKKEELGSSLRKRDKENKDKDKEKDKEKDNKEKDKDKDKEKKKEKDKEKDKEKEKENKDKENKDKEKKKEKDKEMKKQKKEHARTLDPYHFQDYEDNEIVYHRPINDDKDNDKDPLNPDDPAPPLSQEKYTPHGSEEDEWRSVFLIGRATKNEKKFFFELPKKKKKKNSEFEENADWLCIRTDVVDYEWWARNFNECIPKEAEISPMRLPDHIRTIFQNQPSPEKCEWFNAFADRYFCDMKKSALFVEQLMAIMSKQIAKINPKRPSFLGEFSVVSVTPGTDSVHFESARMMESPKTPGELVGEMKLIYKGSASVTIASEVYINWPTSKFAKVPVMLSVTLDNLSGTLQVYGSKEDFSRFSASFVDINEPEFNANIVLGEKLQISKYFPQIKQFIINQLRKILWKHTCTPNKISFSLPLPGIKLGLKTIKYTSRRSRARREHERALLAQAGIPLNNPGSV